MAGPFADTADDEVETLPGNAPGDDRTDLALQARSQAVGQNHDLEWLLEGVEQPVQPGAAQPQQQPAQEQAEPKVEGWLSIPSARNVADAFAETPRMVLGGVRDAAQSILDFGDWAEQNIPLGGTQFVDPNTGEFDFKFLNSEELAANREAEGGNLAQLPDVGQPQTVAGSVIRAVTQFLAPFSVASKAMKVGQAASTMGNIGRASAAGALTDFLAFDPNDPRLTNLIQEFVGRNIPIIEYLAADENDGEIEGRFKNALEGLGIGVVAEGAFRGIKAFRAWRKLKAQENGAELTAEAMRTASEEQLIRDASDLSLLGSADESMPLAVDRNLLGQEMAKRQAATSLPTPNFDVQTALTTRPQTARTPPSENYVRDLGAEAPFLFREMDEDGLAAIMTNQTSAGPGGRVEMFFADVPELALGQGGNKGFRVVMSGEGLAGKINTSKPAWEITYPGGAEYIVKNGVGQDKVLGIFVPDGAKFASGELRHKIAQDFVETVKEDGGTWFARKGTPGVADIDAGVPLDVMAKSLTKRGLTPLEGAKDVYINFARINAPEDIQKIINDTAQAFSGDIDAARRGVRTNSETALSADKIDAWQVLSARRKGEPLNAEQSVAARQLWATSADKLGQIAELAVANPTPENLFQFRRMMATHVAIEKEVIAARTETARALQSWAIPAGGNKERMVALTDMLNRSGGVEMSAELAKKVALLAKSPDAAGALSKFTEKGIYAKTRDTIQEYWINALLSGPKTHMVNMLSNSSVAGLTILERAAASRLGRLLGTQDGVELGEAAAQLQSLRGGIIDAFRNAGKAMRTGQTGFGVNKLETPRERMISSGTWNMRSNSWMGQGVDALGAIVNIPGRMLQAEDEFFKTIGYRMEVHAQAQRAVTRELREGKIGKEAVQARYAELLDNPPESIRLEAASTAAYQTFTTPPGKFTQSVQKLIGEYPGLRFVVPFINTPTNILKYTFERTPLAPISARYRNAIAKGGAEADLARTRMAMGTMTLMLAMDLAMHGNATGSGPQYGAERDNWRRQGYQPYSIKLGDKYFAFNRMDPLGYHLGIAADLAEYVLNADPEEVSGAEYQEAMSAAAFAVAENVTSKSYMQGLAGLMEAFNDPDRFGATYIERFASSFVPTISREVATFIDPVQRQSHDIVSAIKRKIPGMTEGLPARRDLWGREIAFQSGMGEIYDAVSPIYASGFKPEPIDLAMEKDGWFIGMGGSNFQVDGETISLRNRPDIKNRFYELRGGTKPSQMGEAGEGLLDTFGDRTAMEVLNDMVSGKDGDLSDQWQNAPTADDREDLATRIFRRYTTAAKTKLFEEFPWVEETAARLKAQRLGLGTEQ